MRFRNKLFNFHIFFLLLLASTNIELLDVTDYLSLSPYYRIYYIFYRLYTAHNR